MKPLKALKEGYTIFTLDGNVWVAIKPKQESLYFKDSLIQRYIRRGIVKAIERNRSFQIEVADNK